MGHTKDYVFGCTVQYILIKGGGLDWCMTKTMGPVHVLSAGGRQGLGNERR